jgi:hypothetical protein
VDDYWGKVHRRWDASIEAAKDGQIDNSAQLRHNRFQRIWIPLRSYVPIAVTGAGGAGKSVIYDAITDRIGKSYKFPSRSDKADDWRARTGRGKRRSNVYIIPGDRDSVEQDQGFTAMFRKGNYPKGVIHVVNWGYDWIWENRKRRAVAEDLQKEQLLLTGTDMSMETLRKENLDGESEFFDVICDLLRGAWTPAPRGIWFIVAVTKCDLYWPRMDEVKYHYLPDSDSDSTTPFRSGLSKLVTNLSHGGLSNIAILPVSSVLTPYDFSESTDLSFRTEIMAEPSISDDQRKALLNRFGVTIGEFNA